MRDGILLARAGVPALALVTEEFTAQGDFVARAAGMPDIPRVRLPHPVAGTDPETMATIARASVEPVLLALRGADGSGTEDGATDRAGADT